MVVEPHWVYRCGLVTCLRGLPDVASVAEAESTAQALEHPALIETQVIVVDDELQDADAFIHAVHDLAHAAVIVCASRPGEDGILSAIEAGAVGVLDKATLTPETLAGGVRAAVSGAGVVAPELLGTLLNGLTRFSREVLEPRGMTLSRLTRREQQVLSMIADGHPTREVAGKLCYSERTVKNVLHDIVTKLNARSRSQAVAFAVREGLI